MTRDGTAKIHSHYTQRARPKDAVDRKVVFKTVLDNPHRVPWPSISINVQNSILAHLVDLLEGVADFHQSRRSSSKKRKRNPEKADEHHNPKRRAHCADLATNHQAQEAQEGDPSRLPGPVEKLETPPILVSLLYGINAVTKTLENQIESTRPKCILRSAAEPETETQETKAIRFLFVCRSDVDPPQLVDHLPHLVATYNVLRKQDLPPTTLITLPKGAESTLAQAVGVKRLAVLAIIDSETVREKLPMAASLEPLTAPWLSSRPAATYMQIHIKQLRTSAPRDMKIARAVRTQEKAAAKSRRSAKKKPTGLASRLDQCTNAHSVKDPG